jgi:hypothetical protein
MKRLWLRKGLWIWVWWWMPVILATQETEVGRSRFNVGLGTP